MQGCFTVEEACLVGCISEGFLPGSHQPKVLIHQTFWQLTAAFISGNGS